jgi:hypothetical protein
VLDSVAHVYHLYAGTGEYFSTVLLLDETTVTTHVANDVQDFLSIPSGIGPVIPDQNDASSSPEIGRLHVYAEVTFLNTIREICFRSTKQILQEWMVELEPARDVTKIVVALLGELACHQPPFIGKTANRGSSP